MMMTNRMKALCVVGVGAVSACGASDPPVRAAASDAGGPPPHSVADAGGATDSDAGAPADAGAVAETDAGPATGADGGAAPTPPSIVYTNETVLGRRTDNVLKGMTVAVDAAGRRAFVAGIPTGSVAVVSLDTGRLVSTFRTAADGWYVRKMAYDATHGKLWIVSTKGDRIWIATPGNGQVVAEKDTRSDTRPGATGYTVRSIALDPSRETLYIARSDGNRVVKYDARLQKATADILVGRDIFSLAWDAAGDRLVALAAPRNGDGAIYKLPQGAETGMTNFTVPRVGGRGARLLALDSAGATFVGGDSRLTRYADSGTASWNATLSDVPEEIAAAGSEVGVLFRMSESTAPKPYASRLATFNATTGEAIATRALRFEASRMDGAGSAGGFVVGNGGDASVSIVPPASAAPTTVKVGSSTEDVYVTPDGRRLLVLNRLGGSQLVEVDLATGRGRTVEVGDWPIGMTARASDDKLFVLSHYESKVTVVRISDLSIAATIPLGIPGSTSDTIGDIVGSEDGALIVALIGEQGKAIVIDGVASRIVASIDVAEARPDQGPGALVGAVDGARRRVFVWSSSEPGTLMRLDAPTFAKDASRTVSVAPSQSAAKTYAQRILYISDTLGKMFLGNTILDPETLATTGTLTTAHRIIGEETGVLWAQTRTPAGDETLVKLDATSYRQTASQPLFNTPIMTSSVDFDRARRRVAFGVPAVSEVHFVNLP